MFCYNINIDEIIDTKRYFAGEAPELVCSQEWKKMKKVLFVVFAVMLALAISGCSDSAQKPASATDSTAKQEIERSGVITAEKAEMRKGPGKERESLGFFTFGEKVRVIRPKGVWTEVEKEDKQKVWVNNRYLAELDYGKDKYLPEAVIYQPHPAYVETYDVCPKKDLPLLATWKENAKVTGKIKAGERAQVIEHKRVVGPKGTVSWQGKTVYVLTPEVGHFFLYYADGTVTYLTFNGKGIKMADEYMPGWKKAYETTAAGGKGDTTWIRVIGTKGEGWFCVNDYDYNIFLSEKGTGMFLSRAGGR